MSGPMQCRVSRAMLHIVVLFPQIYIFGFVLGSSYSLFRAFEAVEIPLVAELSGLVGASLDDVKATLRITPEA
ncbi:hypothetical protein L1987_87061 [Smallanthus sonchifolius]|nr:hypothetical protein L1987_87061 [Smallanthus sonchifolius]